MLVVLLWYSLFRVAFLPPVTDNGALNNNGALRLVFCTLPGRMNNRPLSPLQSNTTSYYSLSTSVVKGFLILRFKIKKRDVREFE